MMAKSRTALSLSNESLVMGCLFWRFWRRKFKHDLEFITCKCVSLVGSSFLGWGRGWNGCLICFLVIKGKFYKPKVKHLSSICSSFLVWSPPPLSRQWNENPFLDGDIVTHIVVYFRVHCVRSESFKKQLFWSFSLVDVGRFKYVPW